MSAPKTRKKYSKLRFILFFALCMSAIAGLQAVRQFKVPPYPAPSHGAENQPQQRTAGAPAVRKPAAPATDEHADSCAAGAPAAETADTLAADSATACRSIRAGSALWSYPHCFPDLQDVQLRAAQRNGIPPLQSRGDVAALVRDRQLVDISASPFYALDELDHSVPFLVPKAQQLLNTIAINFIDSLRSKGLPPHLPVVSSVLRSADDVTRLRRGNKNATANSCHCYGTTVDIAYHRFVPLTPTPRPDGRPTRWDDNLKFVLGEVLHDLRAEGLCYVKYEYRQACFHLTVR